MNINLKSLALCAAMLSFGFAENNTFNTTTDIKSVTDNTYITKYITKIKGEGSFTDKYLKRFDINKLDLSALKYSYSKPILDNNSFKEVEFKFEYKSCDICGVVTFDKQGFGNNIEFEIKPLRS